MTHIDAQADPPADPLAVTRRPFRVAPKPVKTRTIPTDRWQLQLSPFDFLFGLVVVATSVAYFRLSEGLWFSGDDWPLAGRGATLGDFLEPYNKHLSISIIAIYRVAFTIFGFDTYAPLRIAGIACFVAVAVALYLVLRRPVGPLIAAFVASYMLWFPGTGLAPALLNHYLAVLGGVVCAWALMRDDRTGDWVVAGGLAFALIGAGGGISVIAACFVHAACTRARLGRWIAVVVPSAAWLIWFVGFGEAEARQSSAFAGLTTGQTIREAFEGVVNTFEALAFGIRPLGILLALAFAAHLGWRLRQGLVASANVLAWTAALSVWWIGLIYSRGILADTETFRYLFVGAVFIVLAMIPPKPLKLPDATRSLTAAVAVALAIGVAVLVNRPDIVDQAERGRADRPHGQDAGDRRQPGSRGHPRLVPAPAVHARAHRQAVPRGHRSLGLPAGHTSSRRRRPHRRAGGHPTRAGEESGRAVHPAELVGVRGRAARVRVQTGATPTTVVLVRFGAGPTRIGDLGPNQTAIMTLPGLVSDRAWAVGAPGACVVNLTPAP